MIYKTSKYNILLNKQRPYLLFNTLRLSLSEIEPDMVDTIKNLLSSDKIDENNNPSLVNKLRDNGFVVPADFNELDYLKLAYFKTKFSPEILDLVIFVTKACNFKCSYCFENISNAEYLTDEKIQSLIKFVEERIKKSTTLFINWFGGEPLLNFKVIEKLSEHFINLCEKYDSRYAACMSTNGYLLTPKIVDKFPRLKIERIQTTLDGPREIHDRRRLLKDGGPTYDVILNNIRYIMKNNIPVKISIRCNIDQENIDYLTGWLEEFPDDLRNKIPIYFAPATPGGEENCAAADRKELCMDGKESSEIIPELMSFAIKQGLLGDFDMQRRNIYCIRDKANQFVIGSDCSLYSCPVGLDKIGNINQNGELELDTNKHLQWLSKDPLSDNACKECKLLPLCFGGCNLVRVRTGRKGCIILKYNTDNWIRLLHKNKVISA